jgi:hypothetical protein
MPPSAGSTSPRQHSTQVRALSSLAPRRSICSANSSATATPTPPTPAQCCNRLQHTHSVSSTKSSCRALDCASRFVRRRGAALAPVSSSRSRHRRRSTQVRLPQVRALVATTAPIPAPYTALAANRNRLASVAPRLPPCGSHSRAGSALFCRSRHFASYLAAAHWSPRTRALPAPPASTM